MSKSKRKAKRPPAKPPRARKAGQLTLPLGSPGASPRVDRMQTGQGIEVGNPATFPAGVAMSASGWPVFNLVMRKPHPRAARAIQQELTVRDAQRAKRDAAAARLARRPDEMRQPSYRLPDDVRAFLQKQYPVSVESGAEWQIMNVLGWPEGRVQAAVHEVLADAMHDAYARGCVEGYIEGYVVRRMPDKQRSDKGNAAKRRVLITLPDGTTMTRDERDAAIVAQYTVLRSMVGATEAQYRLAQKYDLTDKMIRIIAGKAKRAGR